jgi:hypothetical protein
MYSAHLAQMIALYESISGDMTYSTNGWDFIWDNQTKIHYTTQQLNQVIWNQMNSDPTGGVCCEPGVIFTPCNEHQVCPININYRQFNPKCNKNGL